MKLILEDENFKHIKTISDKSNDFEKLVLDVNKSKKNLYATLLTFNEIISCFELKKIKKLLNDHNIKLSLLITSSRETNISSKHLKIKTDFHPLKKIKNISDFIYENKSATQTHQGIVRSGEKISSNGDLIIIGDVNPGAQISARGNIYVWGKLCGIAFAGSNGEEKCFIAALYLNPLQLRINQTVAIGPKEKPNDHYPEIAILDKGRIVIKPLLINK